MPRYAIYWAPPADSTLAQLGERWLGREAATDRELEQPALPRLSHADVLEMTAEPRRYGLHATLKPPFRLAAGYSLADLESRLASFAVTLSYVRAPPLRVTTLANFLALTPQAPCNAIDTLAAKCVEALDCFRSAPNDQELARRRRSELTPRQEDYLRRWGYPYVMEEFRFHVSLTGAIDCTMADHLLPILAKYFALAAAEPLEIDEIALFVEPDSEAPFRLVRRFSLRR